MEYRPVKNHPGPMDRRRGGQISPEDATVAASRTALQTDRDRQLRYLCGSNGLGPYARRTNYMQFLLLVGVGVLAAATFARTIHLAERLDALAQQPKIIPVYVPTVAEAAAAIEVTKSAHKRGEIPDTGRLPGFAKGARR